MDVVEILMVVVGEAEVIDHNVLLNVDPAGEVLVLRPIDPRGRYAWVCTPGGFHCGEGRPTVLGVWGFLRSV